MLAKIFYNNNNNNNNCDSLKYESIIFNNDFKRKTI